MQILMHSPNDALTHRGQWYCLRKRPLATGACFRLEIGNKLI